MSEITFGPSEIITIFVLVVGAIVYVTSALRKQRTSELQDLADTRGNRVNDLEKQIHEMEQRLAKLEGAYAGLQALKVTEIADEVVSRLQTAFKLPTTEER